MLGNLSNVMGLDGVIILGVQLAVVVGIILLVRLLIRRNASSQAGGTTETRLRQLETMRSAGTITETEYQEQRRRILSQI